MQLKKNRKNLLILCIFLLGTQPISAEELDPTTQIFAGIVGLFGSAFVTYLLRNSIVEERDSFPRSRISIVSYTENCHRDQNIENQPIFGENNETKPIITRKCFSTYYFLVGTIWLYIASGILFTRGFAGLE